MYISNIVVIGYLCFTLFFPPQNYFGDAWNVFDFIIVLGSFIDIIYAEVNVSNFKWCFLSSFLWHSANLGLFLFCNIHRSFFYVPNRPHGFWRCEIAFCWESDIWKPLCIWLSLWFVALSQGCQVFFFVIFFFYFFLLFPH